MSTMNKKALAKHYYPTGAFVGDQPIDINDALYAYPSGIEHLLPPVMDIPDEFLARDNKWKEFINAMIFIGLKPTTNIYPRDGVDAKTAFRHIASIARSFQPKHEYKEAAMACLLDKWFTGYSL